MRYLISVILILTGIFTVLGQKKKPVKTSNKPTNTQSKPTTAKLKDVIAKAQSLYFQGVSSLAEGKAVEAQKAFDNAKLIVSSAKVADIEQPKLSEFFEKLVNSIYLAQNGDIPPPKSIAESSPNSPINPVDDEAVNQPEEKKPIPIPTPYKTTINQTTNDYYQIPGIPRISPVYEEKKRPANTSTLTIRAIMSNLTFLILDKSLTSILMDGGLNPIVKSKRGKEYDLLETFYKSLNDGSSGKYLMFRAQAFNLINKHKINEVQTDYSREAKIDLPFGTYYIFSLAWYRTGASIFDKTIKYVWDKEVIITKDDSTLFAGFSEANYVFK